MPASPARRRAASALALASVAAAVLAPSASSASATRAHAAPRAHTAIVGGTPASITQVPWQVFLSLTGPDASCGGSILDATHVLTAAHCVVPSGQSPARPASAVTVLAGFSDVTTYVPGRTPPAGAQVAPVASLRIHPGYVAQPQTDDVAVLTLAKPLNLATAYARPIGLAPVGAGPAPGTMLGFSGYGEEHDGTPPDFKLYAAQFGALSDDGCRAVLSPNASASVLCVQAPTQAPCYGDSGGPLVAANGQVGVASFSPPGGCGQGPTGFADVTSPEVRAFVDGSDQPPVAPRQGAVATLSSVNPPVVGSPLTCAPGAWSAGASFAYTFEVDATGQVLQSGSGNVFVPRAPLRGAAVVCVVQASNAGGISTARSGTMPPIQGDTIPPRSAIRSVRCRGRSCTISLDAGDANSTGALSVHASARYRVVARCRKGRGRHRRTVRCTKLRSVRLAVAHRGGVHYRAVARRLPYGHVQLRVQAVDAAGNRQRGTSVANVTLRRRRHQRR